MFEGGPISQNWFFTVGKFIAHFEWGLEFLEHLQCFFLEYTKVGLIPVFSFDELLQLIGKLSEMKNLSHLLFFKSI